MKKEKSLVPVENAVRALIVEDNASFSEILRCILASRFPGLSLAEARSGEDAWEEFRIFRPDLVFMDIHLPGVNGLELARQMKTSNAGVRIVVLTGYDFAEYRDMAASYGIECFLSKNTSSGSEILAKVDSILSAGETQSPRR